MDGLRLLLARSFGRRLPVIDGDLAVAGIASAVRIQRDGWGVPHIHADADLDAWYGLGFCQGQDRAFQLEFLLRLGRGTLAALVGREAVAIDRLSRRIGFADSAQRQIAALAPDLHAALDAFTRGVTAGATRGLPQRPHELALLRSQPTPWTAADVLTMGKLQSFLLAANWDAELARLTILREDGPEALTALEPGYPAWLPVTALQGGAASQTLDRLAADLAAFTASLGPGGGSNNWVLAGTCTASGRPLLANDPHLSPMLPPHWYLAHVRTPRWGLAGATLVGTPVFGAGHNGSAAWGTTAGLVDNTDLFLEELGPDGRSVRRGDHFVPCAVRIERIEVNGGAPITEAVLVTSHGPIVSPAPTGEAGALSLRATWLEPLPVEGFFRLNNARSFEEFRQAFVHWPFTSQNVLYADTNGAIGWQLVGRAPRRRTGWGTLPLPARDPQNGWEAEPVPFAALPHLADPTAGFITTANNQPLPDGEEPFLGVDWVDGYRAARIAEALAARRDWDVAGTQALQLDQQSLPWRELREIVLAAATADAAARRGQALLRAWDGRVSGDSPAAAIFEFFTAALLRRIMAARAPRSAAWALGELGEPFSALLPGNIFAIRRMGQLVRLLRDQPVGWLARSWPEEIAEALAEAVHQLEAQRGPDVRRWSWGRVRPLTLRHPLGGRRPLARIFNLGPFPWGGDANTVSQAGSAPANPADNPFLIASLRMVLDVGAWDASRFVLPGGQSGNPLSPHYADQLPLWQRGGGIPIPWSTEAVAAATRHTLRLMPAPLKEVARPTRVRSRWGAPVVAVTAVAALLVWRAWTRRSGRRDRAPLQRQQGRGRRG